MQGPRGTMQRAQGRRMLKAVILLFLVCLLAMALPMRFGYDEWPLAQSSAGYDLSWSVVAGGGGRIESVGHTLLSTIGQAVAGPVTSDSYTLAGGFWGGGRAGEVHRIHLPLVLRGLP